jgi:hypothetical protein
MTSIHGFQRLPVSSKRAYAKIGSRSFGQLHERCFIDSWTSDSWTSQSPVDNIAAKRWRHDATNPRAQFPPRGPAGLLGLG